MSSWFQDALDTVSGAASDIAKATTQGVTDIAKVNIQNVVKNATDKTVNKNSVDPNAMAPVTTGVNPDGSLVAPGGKSGALPSTGVPTWALWLGGLSLIAATIGVVVAVRS